MKRRAVGPPARFVAALGRSPGGFDMAKRFSLFQYLFRTFGHCTTEVWTATEWARFKSLIQGLSEAA